MHGFCCRLSKDTKVLFRAEHLQHLVRLGLWADAITYVFRFVPAGAMTDGAKLLIKFIRFVSRVSECNPHGASSSYEYNPYSSLQIRLHGGVTAGGIKLAKIIASVRTEEVWASINWPLVRLKAAEIVGHLVAQIPELNDMRRLPLCLAKPVNVLPIGQSSRVNRRIQNKSFSRMEACELARSFLAKKRLPSCQGTSHSGAPLEPITMTRVARLIEECLQAGKCVVLNGKHPTESPYTEGMKMVAGAVVHRDAVAGSSRTRIQASEHQECDTRMRQIAGNVAQVSGLSSQGLLGDGRVGDVGSNMKSWNGGDGDCGPPTDIRSP